MLSLIPHLNQLDVCSAMPALFMASLLVVSSDARSVCSLLRPRLQPLLRPLLFPVALVLLFRCLRRPHPTMLFRLALAVPFPPPLTLFPVRWLHLLLPPNLWLLMGRHPCMSTMPCNSLLLIPRRSCGNLGSPSTRRIPLCVAFIMP